MAVTLDAVKYIDIDGSEQTTTNYTVVTSGDTAWSAGFYVVESDTVISNSVAVSGNVKLIVKDGVTLTVTAANAGEAGICVTGGTANTFTIYGQTASSGQVIVTGGSAGAGIGGNEGETGSYITIAGGTVVATAGEGGAGLGGGRSSADAEANGENITIYGGTVIARGKSGAGIGGGSKGYGAAYDNGGAGNSIFIYGGDVDAASINVDYTDYGKSGAGIGGGYTGDASNIRIYGGKVVADGGTNSAAIGGGGYGTVNKVRIYGGEVYATASNGAAIGGGKGRAGEDIKISGGTVVAQIEEKAGATAGKTGLASAIGSGTDGAENPQPVAGSSVGIGIYANISAGADASSTTLITGRPWVTDALSTAKYAVATGFDEVEVTYVDAAGESHTITTSNLLRYDLEHEDGYGIGEYGTTTYVAVGYDYNNDGKLNADDATAAVAQGYSTTITINEWLEIDGDVKFILTDGFTLVVDASAIDEKAALRVINNDPANPTSTLVIYGQENGTGTLTATGGSGAAAIGGSKGCNASCITIEGGTINATAGAQAAAIGGGAYSGNGSNITIAGGVVTATGGADGGAGIGGGRWGGADGITISGGEVYATGSTYGAAIGSGHDSNDQGGAQNITISGGTVVATATGAGAAIGSGNGSNADGITISGGIVIASNNSSGAAIGAGSAGNVSNVTISGGTVDADGFMGAAIGGGNQGNASNITISGGVIDANGGSYGAGIGGGANGGDVDGVTISGGVVNATGGVGAGIGGGETSGTAANINVTGGKVTAQNTTGRGAAIGGGGDAKTGSNITVSGDYVVKAGADAASASTVAHTSTTDITDSLKAQYVSISTQAQVTYVDENGDYQTIGTGTGTSYTLINADNLGAGNWNAGYYVVGADYNNDGVINAEDAALGTNSFSLGYRQVQGDVKVIVADGFTLTLNEAKTTYRAGIKVVGGGTVSLAIYGGTASTGTLISYGGRNAAAIGGDDVDLGGNAANITIAGGTVLAYADTTAGYYSAGIGGGGGNATGTATNINITGGYVVAQSARGGAGIGGGGSTGSDIEISGGTVFATGLAGAGIGGGGDNATGSDITISGGYVEATSQIYEGGQSGAGIGGGVGGAGNDITISGGTVVASTAKDGSAIGGGYTGSASGITISGGEVIASATGTGAAIGSGQSADASGIEISGGTVDADSSMGAAIGSGKGGKATNITVSGGYVDANCANNGAGIGGGTWGGADTITISGGTVKAHSYAGAGIGSGHDSSGQGGASNITISGGDITADSSLGAGIGSGNSSSVDGITISGGTIHATANGNGGAGIGAGTSGAASNITISDGDITAQAAGDGAGIGSGSGGAASNIVITGGTINAQNTKNDGQGAGIGAGSGQAATGITISGGSIYAKSDRGAGIGGGWDTGDNQTSNIAISGGTITARGYHGAGIGGGGYNFAHDITISGGTIDAYSSNGAGIGAGTARYAWNISFTGGEVSAATGNDSAAAIGAGSGSGTRASNITVDEQWTVRDGDGEWIQHVATDDLATDLDNELKSTVWFEATTIESGIVYNTKENKTYRDATESKYAFTVNGGTLNLAQGTTFSGNAEGAIYNEGNVNIQGAVNLVGENDLIGNFGEITWDLTSGSQSKLDFSISDWSKVTDSGYLNILVDSASQYQGLYKLASNISADAAAYSEFSLKGVSGEPTLCLTDTKSYTESGVYYGLNYTPGEMSLIVAQDKECSELTKCEGVATHVSGGTTEKMFTGGKVITTGEAAQTDTSDSTVVITGGRFKDSLMNGDVAADGIAVTQEGDLLLAIEGGSFSKRVAGGMYVNDASSSVELDGDVNLTISAGTFEGRIYGGCNAKEDALGVNTTIDGNVNVLVNCGSESIEIQNCLIGGSRGAGKITGDVTVTFTGYGSSLSFGENSIVAGGSNSDIVKCKADGTRETVSTVDGDRNLVFDDFYGDFAADIRLFSTASFKNDAEVTLTNENVDLWSIESWNFGQNTALKGIAANDFTGDTLTFDVTELDSDWEVMSGSEAAFDTLNLAGAVYFGTSAAHYDEANACWTDDTYKLAIDNKTTLVVSKIA